MIQSFLEQNYTHQSFDKKCSVSATVLSGYTPTAIFNEVSLTSADLAAPLGQTSKAQKEQLELLIFFKRLLSVFRCSHFTMMKIKTHPTKRPRGKRPLLRPVPSHQRKPCVNLMFEDQLVSCKCPGYQSQNIYSGIDPK